MKKILYAISAMLFLLSSCEEWEPVVTLHYKDPEHIALHDPNWSAYTPIADLCARYQTGRPFTVAESIRVCGQVTTTDQPGNFYKSFYIQDQSGAIEVKIGRNALYNTYHPGQWVEVDCTDLTVGMYGYKSGNYGGQGMVQIGFEDPSGSYETSYIEAPLIIDSHVKPMRIDAPVEPVVLLESQIPGVNDLQSRNPNIGRLVTLRGLSYGGQVFCLLYLNSSADKKAAANRVFLSDTNGDAPIDKTHGVTTLAMSKAKMTEYLLSGAWDDLKIGSGSEFTGQTLGDLKGDGSYPTVEKAAYSVSQYFMCGSREIQIRTSGFAKFADYEIPADVLNGSKKINVTGILSLYQGAIQFTVNSPADFTYEDGTPLYR